MRLDLAAGAVVFRTNDDDSVSVRLVDGDRWVTAEELEEAVVELMGLTLQDAADQIFDATEKRVREG